MKYDKKNYDQEVAELALFANLLERQSRDGAFSSLEGMPNLQSTVSSISCFVLCLLIPFPKYIFSAAACFLLGTHALLFPPAKLFCDFADNLWANFDENIFLSGRLLQRPPNPGGWRRAGGRHPEKHLPGIEKVFFFFLKTRVI